MKRYVAVRRSAAGATSVTVSLVDGELSASWTVKTYVGHVGNATKVADDYAHQALDEVRQSLEPGGGVMEELPLFRMSWGLRLALWSHEHPWLLLALSVSAFLVVWAS